MNSRIWSLWDMLRKYSAIFGWLMTQLYDFELMFYHPILDSQDAEKAKTECIPNDQSKDLAQTLGYVRQMATDLALDAVLPLVGRIEGKQKTSYLISDAHRDLVDLRSRIDDQLKERWFLYVPPAFQDYYHKPQLFGDGVESSFPSAIDDIEDAGKCLAVGQGTACVMHLMRVMEVGLKALANSLKIPYAPSWESYLNQIQSKIATKHKTKGVKWKRDEKFYRDVSGDLISVKQAWRNPTMHIDRRYSKEEAEEIFKAVKTFISKIASKMDENGQDVTWLST
jgi:hypothetical protein